MKEKFAKLINVKSIVTLILTAVFSWLAIKNRISGSEFLTIFTMIIAFYFGTQKEKKEVSDNSLVVNSIDEIKPEISSSEE